MKVLITGSRGLIGGRLSQFLSKNKVHVLKTSRFKKKGFTKIIWSSKKKLENLCEGVDVIINCTGVDMNNANNLGKVKKINSILPLRLFRAANKKKVKLFIFLSTFHVYDFKKSKIINEKSKISLKNNYSKSKILGEYNLLRFKKKYTKVIVIRPCNLFGYTVYKNSNCWKLLMNGLIKNLVLGKKTSIRSKSNQYRNYSSLKSFCIFIFNLLKKYKSLKLKNDFKILNFTSNYNLNLTQITHFVLLILNKKQSLIKFKYNDLYKSKKNIFKSLYQKKIYNSKDKFFEQEVKLLAAYVKRMKK